MSMGISEINDVWDKDSLIIGTISSGHEEFF